MARQEAAWLEALQAAPWLEESQVALRLEAPQAVRRLAELLEALREARLLVARSPGEPLAVPVAAQQVARQLVALLQEEAPVEEPQGALR